jgi:hypothetical protein
MPRPYAMLMSSDDPLVAIRDTPALRRTSMPSARSPRLRQNREVWNTRITSISLRAAAAITAS